MTVFIILGALFSFMSGAVLGQRLATGPPIRQANADWSIADQRVLVRAALWCGMLGGVLLILFLVQVASNYGVAAVWKSSPSVRLAIMEGFASLGIKYLYFAIPLAAFAAVKAAISARKSSRRRWLLVVTLAAASGYFSTGRATVVLIGVVAVACYFAVPGKFSMRRVQAVTIGLATLGLAVFIIGGEFLGKTLENAPIRTANSPLTTKRTLTQIALPYEYVTAPIAALNSEVKTTPLIGTRYGCATFATACEIMHIAGVPVAPVDQIRPSVAVPFLWNTYTALDRPLLDGGILLAETVVLILGLLSGWVFALAQRGHLIGICVYGVVAASIVFSVGTNIFFAPHITAGVVVIVLATAVARSFENSALKRSRREAMPSQVVHEV